MKKKLFIVALATIIAVMAISGASLAWLQDSTEEVTNTFVEGKIDLTITETPNKGSQWEGKFVPGATEAKDPKLTVGAGSEKCYVYALVDNQLGDCVELDIDSSKWEVVKTEGTKTLYRYMEVVDASSADQVLPVFTTVTYVGAKITQGDDGNIDDLAKLKIVISGFAHQSEYATQTVSDNAASAWAFPAATN